MGWPAPVAGDSGNGAHLLYRVELPNDDKVTAVIKAALVALDGLFSDDRASVDTAVFNASRIWKIYGTIARKGDNTESRPHRRSRLLSVPDPIAMVTREQLAALAITDPGGDTAAPTSSPRGTGRRPGEALDLAGWFREHGLGVIDSRPYLGGDLYRLDSCPFSSAHTDGAFAIQFASGAIYAGCHHASCGGGSQRWPELRERFEGSKVSAATHDEKEAAWRKKKAAAREAAARRDNSEPALVEADTADAAVLAEAQRILETGDPLAYMVDTFNLQHMGDQVLARCLALSLASRLIANSKGLHVMTTGESGKGKSDGCRVMLRQLPDAFKLKGSFSDKSLYYKEDLRPQSVFVVDDKDLSDSIQEVLKEATSDFRESIEHHTLTTDRKPMTCRIPARCLWWVAKAEGTGDDQVLNRMLMVWVDESEAQDRAVMAGIMARECRDDDESDGEPYQVAVCRAMWEILQGLGLIEVNLSRFADRIRFSSARNRRNPIMLNDLIRSTTLLRFFQRDHRILENGSVRVYATPDDFKTASDIFTALHGEAGSQETKLTQREAQVLDLIDRADLSEFSILKIQRMTKIPYQQIYRTFLGFVSHGNKYSGLLEKCPALATLEKSVSAPDDAGGSVRRRMTAFTFNREIYSSWRQGGLVWLSPDDDHGLDPGADDFHHFHQTFITFSSCDENKLEPDPAANGGDTVRSSCVHNENTEFSSDLKNTQAPLITSNDSCVCPCYSAFDENEIGKTLEGSQSSNENAVGSGSLSSRDENVMKTWCKRPEVDENGPEPAVTAAAEGDTIKKAVPALSLAQVNPGDYSPIPGGLLIEPCPVCGGRVVHYTERYQARQARGKQERSRHICRGCYNRARAREQAAVQILPGALPLDEVTPANAGLFGRCSVCGLQAAAYCHTGSGTAICSVCYEKLVREQVDIR